MTFEDDMLLLRTCGLERPVRITCKSISISWPPPEQLILSGITFKRIRFSEITDEQRKGMNNVIRAAEYIEEDNS
jgi:hypothetical protein